MWDKRIMEAEGGVQFSLGEHCQLSGCRRGVADHFKSSASRRNINEVSFDATAFFFPIQFFH